MEIWQKHEREDYLSALSHSTHVAMRQGKRGPVASFRLLPQGKGIKAKATRQPASRAARVDTGGYSITS